MDSTTENKQNTEPVLSTELEFYQPGNECPLETVETRRQKDIMAGNNPTQDWLEYSHSAQQFIPMTYTKIQPRIHEQAIKLPANYPENMPLKYVLPIASAHFRTYEDLKFVTVDCQIPLSSIKIGPFVTRKISRQGVAIMKEAIRSQGFNQLMPLAVSLEWDKENGKWVFVLVDGQHRTIAMLELTEEWNPSKRAAMGIDWVAVKFIPAVLTVLEMKAMSMKINWANEHLFRVSSWVRLGYFQDAVDALVAQHVRDFGTVPAKEPAAGTILAHLKSNMGISEVTAVTVRDIKTIKGMWNSKWLALAEAVDLNVEISGECDLQIAKANQGSVFSTRFLLDKNTTCYWLTQETEKLGDIVKDEAAYKLSLFCQLCSIYQPVFTTFGGHSDFIGVESGCKWSRSPSDETKRSLKERFEFVGTELFTLSRLLDVELNPFAEWSAQLFPFCELGPQLGRLLYCTTFDNIIKSYTNARNYIRGREVMPWILETLGEIDNNLKIKVGAKLAEEDALSKGDARGTPTVTPAVAGLFPMLRSTVITTSEEKAGPSDNTVEANNEGGSPGKAVASPDHDNNATEFEGERRSTDTYGHFKVEVVVKDAPGLPQGEGPFMKWPSYKPRLRSSDAVKLLQKVENFIAYEPYQCHFPVHVKTGVSKKGHAVWARHTMYTKKVVTLSGRKVLGGFYLVSADKATVVDLDPTACKNDPTKLWPLHMSSWYDHSKSYESQLKSEKRVYTIKIPTVPKNVDPTVDPPKKVSELASTKSRKPNKRAVGRPKHKPLSPTVQSLDAQFVESYLRLAPCLEEACRDVFIQPAGVADLLQSEGGRFQAVYYDARSKLYTSPADRDCICSAMSKLVTDTGVIIIVFHSPTEAMVSTHLNSWITRLCTKHGFSGGYETLYRFIAHPSLYHKYKNFSKMNYASPVHNVVHYIVTFHKTDRMLVNKLVHKSKLETCDVPVYSAFQTGYVHSPAPKFINPVFKLHPPKDFNTLHGDVALDFILRFTSEHFEEIVVRDPVCRVAVLGGEYAEEFVSRCIASKRECTVFYRDIAPSSAEKRRTPTRAQHGHVLHGKVGQAYIDHQKSKLEAAARDAKVRKDHTLYHSAVTSLQESSPNLPGGRKGRSLLTELESPGPSQAPSVPSDWQSEGQTTESEDEDPFAFENSVLSKLPTSGPQGTDVKVLEELDGMNCNVIVSEKLSAMVGDVQKTVITKKAFNKGDIILPYYGKIMTKRQTALYFKALQDDKDRPVLQSMINRAVYLCSFMHCSGVRYLRRHKLWVLPDRDHLPIASYINDCQDLAPGPNVELYDCTQDCSGDDAIAEKVFAKEGPLQIRALEDLPSETELFLDYGPHFILVGQDKHTTKKRKDGLRSILTLVDSDHEYEEPTSSEASGPSPPPSEDEVGSESSNSSNDAKSTHDQAEGEADSASGEMAQNASGEEDASRTDDDEEDILHESKSTHDEAEGEADSASGEMAQNASGEEDASRTDDDEEDILQCSLSEHALGVAHNMPITSQSTASELSSFGLKKNRKGGTCFVYGGSLTCQCSGKNGLIPSVRDDIENFNQYRIICSGEPACCAGMERPVVHVGCFGIWEKTNAGQSFRDKQLASDRLLFLCEKCFRSGTDDAVPDAALAGTSTRSLRSSRRGKRSGEGVQQAQPKPKRAAASRPPARASKDDVDIA